MLWILNRAFSLNITKNRIPSFDRVLPISIFNFLDQFIPYSIFLPLEFSEFSCRNRMDFALVDGIRLE